MHSQNLPRLQICRPRQLSSLAPLSASEAENLIWQSANKYCYLDAAATWLLKQFRRLIAPFITHQRMSGYRCLFRRSSRVFYCAVVHRLYSCKKFCAVVNRNLCSCKSAVFLCLENKTRIFSYANNNMSPSRIVTHNQSGTIIMWGNGDLNTASWKYCQY